MDLSLTLDLLPETASKLAIKLGSSRGKLQNIATLDPLPSESEILDCLELHGYGSEYPYCRLMWYDENRKCVKSLSMSEELQVEAPSDLRHTLDSLLAMVGEVRRFTSVQNHAVEIITKSNESLISKNMELREEVILERSTTLALDLALQQMEAGGDNEYKEKGISAILELAKSFMMKDLNPEKIRMYILQNPTMIDGFFSDERIFNVIAQKFIEHKEKGASND